MATPFLLEPEAAPPPNPWPKRLALGALLVAAAGGILYWQFRFYEEKQAVVRFMEALKAGDYQTAYKLWNPPHAYTYTDFLQDWGETTSFGRVRRYEILSVETPGRVEIAVPNQPTIGVARTAESGVIVTVRINGQLEPVRLWVERKDKSLGFPPF